MCNYKPQWPLGSFSPLCGRDMAQPHSHSYLKEMILFFTQRPHQFRELSGLYLPREPSISRLPQKWHGVKNSHGFAPTQRPSKGLNGDRVCRRREKHQVSLQRGSLEILGVSMQNTVISLALPAPQILSFCLAAGLRWCGSRDGWSISWFSSCRRLSAASTPNQVTASGTGVSSRMGDGG